jgi:hypothetical protein
MAYLKNNLFVVLLFLSTLSFGQTITYSYIDPCTKEIKRLEVPSQNGNFPVTVTYYGQVQNFTPQQLQSGEFDIWANSVYGKYGQGNPCSSVGFNVITDNVVNISNVIVTNVLSLNTLINTVSNFGSATSVGTSSAANTTEGKTEGNKSEENKSEGNKSEEKKSEEKKDESNNNSGGGSNGGSSNPNNNPDEKSKPKTEVEDKKVEQETSVSTGSSTNRTTSQASATQRQKPAILLTGDIVGVQRATDGLQDSRITTSYIRMKGDGKTSWGASADFTVRAQVGNISVFKSWITNKTQRKHIDLVSNSVSLLPNTFTNTLVFIRIDNLKKFTWLYGAAGVYGTMYQQPMTAVVTIAGGMYRGKITNKIDAVAILAAIYVPYMKYYTEQVFETKPIAIPFLNINYAVTKAFRIGLTGGTTYSVTENVLNYQLLFGTKLTL